MMPKNPGGNLQIRGFLKMDQGKWQTLLITTVIHHRKISNP